MLDVDDLHAAAVRWVIRDWLPGQAQAILDHINEMISNDPDWMEDDDLAGQCEQLALAARAMARISHIVDRP